MDIPERHPWDVSLVEARALQAALAERLDTETPVGAYRTLAAADVSFNRDDPVLHAAVVVTDARTAEVIETAAVSRRVTFPYVPGFLTFREAPVLLDAFRKLRHVPDVVLCDGQGIAHPRRMGIAAHLGLWLGLPTVGCAKSRLCGDYEEPGNERGDRSPLRVDGEVRGAVLRTRRNVKPLFVSPGHLCDVASAVRIVLEATTRYRLPDASRMAHEAVNAARRAAGGGAPGAP